MKRFEEKQADIIKKRTNLTIVHKVYLTKKSASCGIYSHKGHLCVSFY